MAEFSCDVADGAHRDSLHMVSIRSSSSRSHSVYEEVSAGLFLRAHLKCMESLQTAYFTPMMRKQMMLQSNSRSLQSLSVISSAALVELKSPESSSTLLSSSLVIVSPVCTPTYKSESAEIELSSSSSDSSQVQQGTYIVKPMDSELPSKAVLIFDNSSNMKAKSKLLRRLLSCVSKTTR
uniref:Uncharacterized protein n=1 Tax=Ditylenchus dipsaci TaxID=166011 RepID=A0A915CVZ7_9BILA